MSAVLKVAVMGNRASAIPARVVVVAIFAAALAIQALVPISMAMGDGKMMGHKGGGRVCCDDCSCDRSNPRKCQCKDRLENKCQPWCNACGCVAYSETGVQQPQPLCTCFDVFQDHCGKRCTLPIPPSYN